MLIEIGPKNLLTKSEIRFGYPVATSKPLIPPINWTTDTSVHTTSNTEYPLQYLVKYLGCPGEDEWCDEDDVINAPEMIEQFY